MKIAIVHYHLSPGGVSTVVRAASQALADAAVPHVILVGDSPPADLPCEIVDGLGYLKAPTDLSADTLLTRLRDAAQRELGSQPNIWHFHNHSLGKNTLISQVVDRLAQEGERLVLQLHDLAEDGRPHNYPNITGRDFLYPISPRIHYAFINSRDRRLFEEAGLAQSQSHFLPNPVPSQPPAPPSTEKSPLILYPTRAIRRKNIGEILLLSLLAPKGTRFAITLTPKDPAAKAIHDSWRELAEQLDLPIAFHVVDGSGDASYEAWLKRATHFITTSVAEGFGLNFLESAAFGKPLIGRNLPHITADHPSPIGTLYDRILIPEGAFPDGAVRNALRGELSESHRLYQQPLTEQMIDETFKALRHEGYLDFGNLPESFQRQLITQIAGQGGDLMIESQRVIKSGREWLTDALSQPANPIDLSGFSIESYGGRLSALYAGLMAQPPSPIRHLDSRKILQGYLAPGHFRFLLTSPPKPSLKIRAVIFDIYGTLLIAPPGGFKSDPAFDPTLTAIIESFGHPSPPEPSAVIDRLIREHHRSSPHPHPEIDLRHIFREALGAADETNLTSLVEAVEDARLSCEPMPGAVETLHSLAAQGIRLGILSNAQSNTLSVLDRLLDGATSLLDPELTVLSYQHGMAKPSPELFQLLAERLAQFGISPQETLFVGNDPLQDIDPAKEAGFLTALFLGHPSSLRPGECHPDLRLQRLPEILTAASSPSTQP